MIRLVVKFKCDELPLYHRLMFTSIIKKCYEIVGEEYSRRQKDFAFSIKINNFKVDREKEIISLEDKSCNMVITGDEARLIKIQYGMYNLKKSPVIYKENKIEIEKISLLNIPDIHNCECFLNTITSFIVEDDTGNMLGFNDNDFNKFLNKNIKYNLDTVNYKLKKDIKFFPIKMKEFFVKEKIRNHYVTLRTNRGTFGLIGDKEDLQMIYKLGIGNLRGCGFGVANLVDLFGGERSETKASGLQA